MKKIIVIICFALILTTLLVGRRSENKKVNDISDKYKIGEEISLAGVKFNVYKIDDNKGCLYLMAQKSIKKMSFLYDENETTNNYKDSMIEKKVNRFVRDLENDGINVKSSGIIDKDDLIQLGFEIAGMNGAKYEIAEAPKFLKKSEPFWVDGYCRYDTYAWTYDDGILTANKCENKYGVKPIIVIDVEESEKTVKKT